MIAPRSLYCLMPVLNATVGIPAAVAAAIESFSVSGDRRVTAIPSTLLSTAFCRRVASPGAVGSAEYFRSMLSFAAATVAPARILSQNESPAGAWVTIAIVNRGVSATAPPPPLAGAPVPATAAAADSAAAFPPVELQAVSASAAATATAVSPRAFLRIVIDSGPFVAGQRVPGGGGTSGVSP